MQSYLHWQRDQQLPGDGGGGQRGGRREDQRSDKASGLMDCDCDSFMVYSCLNISNYTLNIRRFCVNCASIFKKMDFSSLKKTKNSLQCATIYYTLLLKIIYNNCRTIKEMNIGIQEIYRIQGVYFFFKYNSSFIGKSCFFRRCTWKDSGWRVNFCKLNFKKYWE